MNRLALVPVVLAAALIGAALSMRIQTARVLANYASDRLTEAQVQQLIADTVRVSALSILPAHRGTRDAGVVLNRILRLSSDHAKADEPAWWDNERVSRALDCPSQHGEDVGTFPTCLSTVPSGDLSMLASLSAYDTWDPASSGPEARRLARPHRESVLENPAPLYEPIYNLAKLRLAQGFASGDVLPALVEVRQLAKLTWSTENIMGELVAMGMLKDERATYEAAVAKGKLDPAAWTPVSEADANAIKHATIGLIGLYLGFAPPDALDRLHAVVPEPPATCGAATEAARTLGLMRRYFTQTWPGEIDLSDRLPAVDGVLRSDRCRWSAIGEAWRERPLDWDLAPVQASAPGWPAVLRLPWLRQAYAAVGMGIVLPVHNPYAHLPQP